jgi:hypothetical protein
MQRLTPKTQPFLKQHRFEQGRSAAHVGYLLRHRKNRWSGWLLLTASKRQNAIVIELQRGTVLFVSG